MIQTNDDVTGGSDLGVALSTLSDSANGLSSNVRALQRAVDDLQMSTERCGNQQAKVSESLAQAADNIAAASTERPDTTASAGFSAVADD